MNPSKAKRRANRNKRKHRDQATRRKTGAEKRPEQLELPVSMPERGAAKSEPQAKTKDPSQHKTKAAAKTDPASSPRFQVASEKAAGAEHKVLPRKPKSAQYATVRPAKTSRPVVNTAGLSSPASDQQSKPASPVWRLYAAMLFNALLRLHQRLLAANLSSRQPLGKIKRLRLVAQRQQLAASRLVAA